MRFTLFDRWGTQIGVVNDVASAIHKDELNGEDSLTLTLASCNLAKGNRIVWRDKFGIWHEHIVNDLKDVHEDGRMYTAAYCETSLAEMFSDYIEELRPYNVSATAALQRALSVTRWQIGTVDVPGTGSASFYHISSREALTLITENWGGELSATIEISGAQVSKRSVNITSRGSDYGKRFEWRKDLRGITREVSTEDVCTALYGYGKGLEAYDEDGNPTGGYERKLTFGEVNGGLDYVADEDAKQVWGLPDGKGGKKHAFGKVEFPDCEDMGELLALTRAELQKRKEPQVSYSASVIDLADAGYEFEDVRTGDTVAIIDRELGERLTGRVLCVERDLFNESETIITLGNIVRTIHDVIADQLTAIGKLRDHSAAWDGAASISESYINGVIRVWNDTMNAVGGYTYYEPGDGLITYDKPEDQNPTMAIQLKGAGFRIASSRKSNGEWDWRTFGTGEGFTADLLNVGVIRGGSNYWNLETGDLLFKQGRITSADGKNFWDLGTGEFQMQSVAGAISDAKGYADTAAGNALDSAKGYADTAAGSALATAQRYADGAAGNALSAAESYADGIGSTTLTAADKAAKGYADAAEAAAKRYAESTGSTVLSQAKQFAEDQNKALSDSLGQQEVFNRLTDGGKTQGIYLKDGKVYVNATYIMTGTLDAGIVKAGILTDAKGSNYWNMATGDLSISSSTAIGGTTAGDIISDLSDAQGDITSLSSSFSTFKANAEGVFATVGSHTTQISSLRSDMGDADSAITSLKATYGTCATAAATAAKAVTCADFALRKGAAVTVKFTYRNTAASPTLNVNGTGAKPIYLNGSALPESAYWGAGQTMGFIYDGTNWVVADGAATAQIVTNTSDISSLKLTAQQFSVDLQSASTAIQTTNQNLADTNGVVTSMQATYATCSTAGGTTEKAATCSNFVLRNGAMVTVKFTYKNTAANPTLNVNGTGAKPITLNGSAIPEDAYWAAGQTMCFVYNGSDWVVTDGATAAQVVTNMSDISSLKLSAQQFSVDISSHTETLTQLKAAYCTCNTYPSTQEKAANCAGFALRTGAMVAVEFAYGNTVAGPTLNVNGTGAKPIYLNGSALPEANWWRAGDVVTLVYNGTYWYVADGATLTQLASTNTNVSNLTLRADTFDVSIKGLQATYGTCSTAGATQTKEVTLANFAKFAGQTVVVRFTYANTAASPILAVRDSDGTVAATGYILVNGNVMSEHYWWNAGDTLTLVWDGMYWCVGDGGTMSRIRVLEDSITLSVTGSLGGTASIKLSVNGEEQSRTIDMSNVRAAFRDDNTAITISAGTVAFNSNTFIVNSTNFEVTASGVITAKSGTIGGFTIDASTIYNAKMTLGSEGMKLKKDSVDVGQIGTNSVASDNSKKGLVFDLEPGGAYMAWAAKGSSSEVDYTLKLFYANKAFEGYAAGRLHITCPSDFHNYVAYNFWIDPDSGGANGGITGTMNFVKVTSMASDGKAAGWDNGCKMVFKRGMLVAATF